MEINDGGAYSAKTEREDGKRVITVNNYYDGMGLEDQARLAVILGHEAYRDGNEKDGNYTELRDAVIAHIDMADRINNDYGWLYALNSDMLKESLLLENVRQTGNMEYLDAHLRLGYYDDNDYFWRSVSTGGDLQNAARYANITLLAGSSREEIDEINRMIIERAVCEIMQEKALEEGFTGDLASFVTRGGMSAGDFRDRIKNDSDFRKRYGIELEKYETLGNSGCMLFALMYGIEEITGSKYDPQLLNDWLTMKGYYTGDGNNDLSTALMEKAWNELAGGFFDINVAFRGMPDLEKLLQIDKSGNDYIAHIRINNNHSVMLQRVEYERNVSGQIIGVRGVQVANPVQGSSTVNGKTFYTPDQITRWDIFKVTPARIYLKYQSYSQGR